MAQEFHDKEGKSVASWTAVGIELVAALFIAAGITFNTGVLTWIGAALVVVGGIAAIGLTAAGFGATPHPAPEPLQPVEAPQEH